MGEPKLKVKAAYSITELAAAARMSRSQVVRLLKGFGLALKTTRGKKRWVLASALKENAPDLWQALVDVNAAAAEDGRPPGVGADW